jgi:hypothetical protein
MLAISSKAGRTSYDYKISSALIRWLNSYFSEVHHTDPLSFLFYRSLFQEGSNTTAPSFTSVQCLNSALNATDCFIWCNCISNSTEHSSSWEAGIVQLVMKFSAFYVARRLTAVFTRAHHRTLFWARWIQSTPPYPVSLRSSAILSFIYVYISQEQSTKFTFLPGKVTVVQLVKKLPTFMESEG